MGVGPPLGVVRLEVGGREPGRVGQRGDEPLEVPAVAGVGAGGPVGLAPVEEPVHQAGDGGRLNGRRGGHELVLPPEGGGAVAAEVDLPAVDLDVPQVAAQAVERLREVGHGPALWDGRRGDFSDVSEKCTPQIVVFSVPAVRIERTTPGLGNQCSIP